MREIKFRAWDGHEMFYDVLAGRGSDACDHEVKDVWFWHEPPQAIMQFTGLKDKNGKEIYEGDIVRHCICEGHEWSGIHEVLFDSGRFCIKGGKPFGIRGNEAFNWYPMNVVVIGNIYENPELLKG